MAEREAKRIRQACQNCRRKKSRCSGERPTCAFCARLAQQCVYDDWRDASFGAPSNASHLPSSNNDVNLLARVALLESKLSMLGSGDIDLFGESSHAEHEYHFNPSDAASSKDQSGRHANQLSSLSTRLRRKFSIVPDLAVLESAADVYFRYCHNQPYAYFHQQSFRKALRGGLLPSSLLLAFMATAARFSNDSFFESRQRDAIEIFASTAWREIFERSFAEEDSSNIHTAQAINMLAVIDYTAGRHKLGWVKIGLSVRFAQGLRLNAEPDSMFSPCEQEEHRRTFWSIYILDRLVSCSPHRPPTISDDDCTVHLPCGELDFQNGLAVEQPTLGNLNDFPENRPTQKLGWFALTVFMASALGRIVRCNLQQSPTNIFTPWDSRGELASIWSVLLTFETHSNPLDKAFSENLGRDFVLNGSVDQQIAGHFVFSQMLYHLNQCLLHHPFLVHQRLRSYKSIVPPSFMKEILQRSKLHAEQLTGLLRDLQHRGYCDHPSFFGYGAAIAGFIHRLFEVAEEDSNVSTAPQYYQASLSFLDRKPTIWSHFPRMAAALRNFKPDRSTAKALVTPLSLRDKADVAETQLMWSLVDYGWLSDLARPITSTLDKSDLDLDIDGWAGMNETDPQNNDPTCSNEVPTRNGNEDDTHHQPLDFFAGDPWSVLIDQVNLDADSTNTKEWESPWTPTLT